MARKAVRASAVEPAMLRPLRLAITCGGKPREGEGGGVGVEG